MCGSNSSVLDDGDLWWWFCLVWIVYNKLHLAPPNTVQKLQFMNTGPFQRGWNMTTVFLALRSISSFDTIQKTFSFLPRKHKLTRKLTWIDGVQHLRVRHQMFFLSFLAWNVDHYKRKKLFALRCIFLHYLSFSEDPLNYLPVVWYRLHVPFYWYVTIYCNTLLQFIQVFP